jgi:hypothetical protein
VITGTSFPLRSASMPTLQVGSEVASSVRAVTSKSYDYFVEASYVESSEEVLHDLFGQVGSDIRSILVVEDALEGWKLQGASSRIAGSAEEAKADFDAARKRRRARSTETAAGCTLSVFSLTVFQYWVATGLTDADDVVCSRICFVEAPGAERLAMDPAILRVREGSTFSHSLLSFSTALQVCRPTDARPSVQWLS